MTMEGAMARRGLIALTAGVIAAGLLGGTAVAGDAGLYGHKGHRMVVVERPRAPRHHVRHDDTYHVVRDDRGVVSCYRATYYPAHYAVNPRGHRVRGARHSYQFAGKHVQKRRHAPLYVETHRRIKEDYVSLKPVSCR
ncbi:MAG: hypothetical protein AAGF45_12145 [Pseudomonadota bacterium]